MGCTNLPPTIQTSVNFHNFVEVYFCSLNCTTLKLGNITNFKALFPVVSTEFSWLVHVKKLKTPILIMSCLLWDTHSNNSDILGHPGAVTRGKGGTKVFKYGQKSPWVPTLTELFPKIQADAGSWLGTKNALYYCAQSANSFSWVLFLSSYTTAIVSITACLAHAQVTQALR